MSDVPQGFARDRDKYFLIAYYLAHLIASCIQSVDLGIDSTAERFRKRMNNVFFMIFFFSFLNCNLPNSFMHPVWSSTRSRCLTHLTSQTAVVGKNVNTVIGTAEKQSGVREGSKPWWDLCLLTSLRILIQKFIVENSVRYQWCRLVTELGLLHDQRYLQG